MVKVKKISSSLENQRIVRRSIRLKNSYLISPLTDLAMCKLIKQKQQKNKVQSKQSLCPNLFKSFEFMLVDNFENSNKIRKLIRLGGGNVLRKFQFIDRSIRVMLLNDTTSNEKISHCEQFICHMRKLRKKRIYTLGLSWLMDSIAQNRLLEFKSDYIPKTVVFKAAVNLEEHLRKINETLHGDEKLMIKKSSQDTLHKKKYFFQKPPYEYNLEDEAESQQKLKSIDDDYFEKALNELFPQLSQIRLDLEEKSKYVYLD